MDWWTRQHAPVNVYANSSHYLPDGRHVLLERRREPLTILEVPTWRKVDYLPEVPEDTVHYWPAPSGKRAVAQVAGGTVVLWDVARQRAVTKLRNEAELLSVAFAPDESRVAVVMRDPPGNRNSRLGSIGIYRTEDGHLLARTSAL